MDYNFGELEKYLVDGDYTEVLRFCIEPKSWKEFSKIKIKQSKLFQIMKDLKIVKALEFADGKYYTAGHVEDYLKQNKPELFKPELFLDV